MRAFLFADCGKISSSSTEGWRILLIFYCIRQYGTPTDWSFVVLFDNVLHRFLSLGGDANLIHITTSEDHYMHLCIDLR